MAGELITINTLICSNDARLVEQLTSVFNHYSEFVLIEPAPMGYLAVEQIQKYSPKLVLIETELPDMSGFDLIHKLYPVKIPQFIFLAKDSEYAVKAFEYFAFDYLVRPFNNERLHLSLLKVKESLYQRSSGQIQEKLNALFRYMSSSNRTTEEPSNGTKNGTFMIPIKTGGRIYFVREDEIQYIVASGYYIEIYANGKKHLLRQSLRGIVEKLDPHKFLRIHRSVVISLSYLKEIIRQGSSDFSARMEDGTSFRISKSYKGEVFDQIGIRN